jgi:hypothetical protein
VSRSAASQRETTWLRPALKFSPKAAKSVMMIHSAFLSSVFFVILSAAKDPGRAAVSDLSLRSG